MEIIHGGDDLHLSSACNYNGGTGTKTCMSDEAAHIIEANAHKIESIPKGTKAGKTIKELDILLNPSIIELLGEDRVLEELKNFKQIGPADTTNYFNNFVLDGINADGFSLSVKHYKGVKVHLMDFMEPNQTYTNELVKMFDPNSSESILDDIKNRNIQMVGCVLNTLLSRGDITKVGHWVALFIDMRSEPYTVEYFNSSGNNAPKQLYDWMEKTANTIQSTTNKKTFALNVSNVVHQKSDTECGAYASYYIYKRLTGSSYKEFRKEPVPDKVVFEFRSKLMNSQDNISNTAFLKKRYLV